MFKLLLSVGLAITAVDPKEKVHKEPQIQNANEVLLRNFEEGVVF